MPLIFPVKGLVEPTISTSGESLYQRVLPVFDQDPKYGWVGRILCDSIMAMLQEVDQIVLDTAEFPGWAVITEPKHCPAKWLPWCAALYGVSLPAGASTTRQREIIEELPPQKRGTTASMVTAAKAVLTGTKTITFIERFEGKAYKLYAHTKTNETPSEEELKNAINTQKPGGLLLQIVVSESPTWEEATKLFSQVANNVTWSNVKKGDI